MEEPVLDNGIPVESEAAVEAPESPAEPTEAPVEAPAWSGPSQEEWQSLLGSVGQLTQAFQPAEEPGPQGIDSYADPTTGELTYEGLDRYINDRVNSGVQERLGQYEPVLNQTVANEGEALIAKTFDGLATSIGEFDRDLARELAEGYANMGFSPGDAIKKGAERAHSFAQAQRQAGVEEYKTTLGNIGKAPHEPGVNGAGFAEEERLPPGHPDRYKRIADNWAARQRLR